MKDELIDRLYHDFPGLYEEDPVEVTFGCDDGWYSLLRKLSSQIATTAAEAGLEPGNAGYPQITLVKQKFGALRVHIACAAAIQDEIDRLNHAVELRSTSVCETCGQPGEVR